jgi:Trk K+ transport system NAD-binding subunit
MGGSQDAIVAAILRDGHAIVPRGDDRIEAGDRIVVFCTNDAAARVRTYFTHETA